MYSTNVIFCRMCLRQFRRDIRSFLKHLPEKALTGVTTWKVSGMGATPYYEVYFRNINHMWSGHANTAAEAKLKAFEEYIKKELPPEIFKQYEEKICDI